MEIQPKTPFSGILLVNKSGGITSHDVVGRVRRLYGTREVGHTGTLDPMATGLLVVLVGRAVKASDMVTAGRKGYRAGLRLGMTTDTEDITGQVLTVSEALPAPARVCETAKDYVGDIQQVPPMVSALKVNGQKLCDLARKGITVPREARTIRVYTLSVKATEDPSLYCLEVFCSKGTYIRTLCADIGKALGCGGVMASLERIENSSFTLDQALTLEQLETMSRDERIACLIPVERIFRDCPRLTLPAFYENLAKNGCEIYQKKIGTDFDLGKRLALYGKEGFYGVGEVRNYPDGSAVKVIKRF